MARIPRKNQKIFAGSASNNGVFGSGQDNTKITSTDLDVLQSKAAFLTGWNSATISARQFPPLEEFQSLMYIATTQLGYLFQEGISEWNASTTYYQKSIVKQTGTYQLYGSLSDNNTGNALTDTVNWVPLINLSALATATTSIYGTTRLAVKADFVSGGSSTNVPTAPQVAQFGFETGDWKGRTLSSLPTGWIWACGNIGNASSGATNRANADTQDLFTAYWNDAAYNYTGTTATGAALQVYSSTGTAVAKGASAAADWAANRRIDVPDFRDRVPAGRGNMIGSAGRLSGQPGGVNGNALGNSGGNETNTLSIANLPTHNFVLPNTISNYPFYRDGGGGGAYPLGWHPTDSFPTNTLGSDAPHNNVQPTMVTNIIIKL